MTNCPWVSENTIANNWPVLRRGKQFYSSSKTFSSLILSAIQLKGKKKKNQENFVRYFQREYNNFKVLLKSFNTTGISPRSQKLEIRSHSFSVSLENTSKQDKQEKTGRKLSLTRWTETLKIVIHAETTDSFWQ